MSVSNLLQITLEMWGCMICLILGIMSSSYIGEKDKIARLLWTMLLINIMTLAGDALAYVYRGDVSQLGLVMTRVSNFMVFATEYVFSGIFTLYTDTFLKNLQPEESSDGKRPDFLVKLCLAMIAADLVLLITSQFNGFYYYFDQINNYHRGPGFAVGMALMGAVMILNILRFFRGAKWMDPGTKGTFRVALCIPLLAYAIQAVHYGFSLINIAITVSLLILYFRHIMEAARDQLHDDLHQAKAETKIAYQKYHECRQELEALKKERGDHA